MNTIKIKANNGSIKSYYKTTDCATEQKTTPNKLITNLRRANINIYKIRGFGNQYFIEVCDYTLYCDKLVVVVPNRKSTNAHIIHNNEVDK